MLNCLNNHGSVGGSISWEDGVTSTIKKYSSVKKRDQALGMISKKA